MFSYLKKNPSMADPEIQQLRNRLDSFYNSTDEYAAFKGELDQTVWLGLMAPYIDELLGKHGRIRVLECGAGRPSFAEFYAKSMGDIEYCVQDVTSTNEEYLKEVADRVHIGDVAEIEGSFHLIFSQFVLEHVANPAEFLTAINRILTPGGIHIIFSPRYDLPLRVCPSLRHLNICSRFLASAFILLSGPVARISGKTNFWVNCDPAVFHGPWYRDTDAVHIVSRGDVQRWYRRLGFSVETIKPPASGWRNYISKRFLTQSTVARKPV